MLVTDRKGHMDICVYTHTYAYICTWSYITYPSLLCSVKALQTLNREITEPLLLGKYRIRFLWASGHNVFVSQFIHRLVLLMILFKDTLFNIYCWLIHAGLRTNSTLTHAWTQHTNMGISPLQPSCTEKHQRAPGPLRVIQTTKSPHKAQKCKAMAPDRLRRGCFLR